MRKSALLFLAAAAIAHATPVKRATDITTIHLDQCSGSPQLFSQGVLYGMSGTTTPPQSYVSDLSINYESAGGAQVDQQPAGYSSNMASYNLRFASVVAAWKRIRQNNGVMIIKMADLWGADETTGNDFVWPGDNGDWTKYDAFLQQVISDVKSNGMANAYSTQLEIWNEPDINFGGRPQSQYNAMYVRTAKALRNAFGAQTAAFLPIVGPSTANNPGSENDWWNSFLSYIQNNGGREVQPDVWNWHMEGGGNNDPIPPAQNLPSYVQNYGLTTGIGLQNNEFGTRPQQVPGYAAWFKARYERLKFNGLRGNWASGGALSDNLADLLLKSNSGQYSTTGEYQAYRYYKLMSGAPCNTDSGSNVDSYAVASSHNATALIGSQSFDAATIGATFTKISAQFGSAKTVKAQIINIPYNGGATVNGWTNSGSVQTLNVNNDQVTVSFDISSAAGKDAWVVRLT